LAQEIESASPVRLCIGASNTEENKINEINIHEDKATRAGELSKHSK
jgi:hypothetical protein